MFFLAGCYMGVRNRGPPNWWVFPLVFPQSNLERVRPKKEQALKWSVLSFLKVDVVALKKNKPFQGKNKPPSSPRTKRRWLVFSLIETSDLGHHGGCTLDIASPASAQTSREPIWAETP